jgi:hypothetical protein
VLPAEDVEIFLELEKTFLQRENIELIAVPGGDEALATVQRERPGLSLLGLSLPPGESDRGLREGQDRSGPAGHATAHGRVRNPGRRARPLREGRDPTRSSPEDRAAIIAFVKGKLLWPPWQG